MGTSDLVKELRARHTPSRSNLNFALQHCVLAARTAGVDILDGVHLDFRNVEAFRNACDQGRDMGFDGKTLIHPAQIETANDVFGYSEAEVEHARAVIAVWETGARVRCCRQQSLTAFSAPPADPDATRSGPGPRA